MAAEAIIDFLSGHTTGIVHLVNPRPVPWRTLAAAICMELDVPLVPYTDWLSRLENAAKGRNHAAPVLRASRLLQFFQTVDGHNSNVEAFGLPKLDMRRALHSSESLRRAGRQLGAGDVTQWIKYWYSVDLL
jgi:hypothetical protein